MSTNLLTYAEGEELQQLVILYMAKKISDSGLPRLLELGHKKSLMGLVYVSAEDLTKIAASIQPQPVRTTREGIRNVH
jgi:hypothetical protein